MAVFALGSGKGADGAARGDGAGAFEELFLRYRQPLYGFFRRRTQDSGRAEELTQECFLALLQTGEKYKPTATFRTFLYAIGLNLVRADRRKSMFRAMFAGEAKGEAGADPATELGLLVRDALGRLDRVDREMLMLREFEELSYAEIGELLQVPVGTVRSRLFRARTALREVWVSVPITTGINAGQEGRA